MSVVTRLLPTLVPPEPEEFDLFEVMHHGTHEKQLSNVFAWLLSADASHKLGDRFIRCFIEEVNLRLIAKDQPTVPIEPFAVEQEQNTLTTHKGADIADIVIRGERSAIVVENYYISDGHGHDYDAYLQYGRSLAGENAVVVMLCAAVDEDRLEEGWKNAPVLTYADLLVRLFSIIDADPDYRESNPDPYWFLTQMKMHFSKGKLVNDDTTLEFIQVMCETGEASRYGSRAREVSFVQFMQEEAQRKLVDSKELLSRVKTALRAYLQSHVQVVNDRLGEQMFHDASLGFSGIYQWAVLLAGDSDRHVQVMFGPTAWADNERDTYDSWDVRVVNPDYSRLFIGYTQSRVLQQSAVSMEDLLNGLAADDVRLVDEIVRAVRNS